MNICYSVLKFVEGGLIINEKGKKDRDRHAFLFDNMLILCKQTTGQRGKSTPSNVPEYRFKEKLLIKHIDVTDLDDTDGMLINYSSLYTRFVSLFIVMKSPISKQHN